jgi:hypothetical protein
MNGIIHVCTHGSASDGLKSFSEDTIMLKIFQYIDKLFDLAKPKVHFFFNSEKFFHGYRWSCTKSKNGFSFILF